MINTKRQGASYEALFKSEALRRGLDVLDPVGDYLTYDVLVTKGKSVFRVQIKGTTSRPKGKKHFKIQAAKGRYSREMLTKDHCDVFAAYVAPAKTWYIIPTEELIAVSMYLSPDNEYSNAQYEMWKEAWNVFA
tara:strand:- start:934 stop:1335 length:402 start_codon:yes stop_codon:yes gene_type:complete